MRDSLTLEGGFYLLGNSSDSWKITKHKELASSEKITKDNLESRIPKKGNILALDASGDSTVDFWGFVSGSGDIEKFCTQSDNCTSTSTGLSPLKKS